MPDEILNTAPEVITALGGFKDVADLTGRLSKTVWYWSNTGSFPSNTYVLLKEALATKGKTAPDSLWDMMEPARQTGAAE